VRGPLFNLPLLKRVVIWDFDGTLAFVSSLSNGSFVKKYATEKERGKLQDKIRLIHSRMQECALTLMKDKMHYQLLKRWRKEQLCSSMAELSLQDDGRDLRSKDVINSLEAQLRKDPRPPSLACAYRLVAQEYEKYNIRTVFPAVTRRDLLEDHRFLNDISKHHLQTAEESLKRLQDPTTLNILLSDLELIPTWAQLLLFELNQFFLPQHVFSSAWHGTGKRHVELALLLNQLKVDLKERSVSIHVVGGGDKDKQECLAHNVAFYPAQSPRDLKSAVRKILKD